MNTQDGKVTLVYTRLLNTGDSQDDVFTGNNRRLTVMYAVSGSGLKIAAKHAVSSDNYYTLDFIQGKTTKTMLDTITIKRWHGGIMWVAWNIFAYFGIMAARFKDILFTSANKGRWFLVHRIFMITTFLLTTVGITLAIVAVTKSKDKHFSNAHMIVGLVIFILVVWQPLNASIRPHKAENVQRQPWPRFIWELIHKNSGRAAALLSIFNIFAGMLLLGLSRIFIILQIVYIVLVASIFIALEAYWNFGSKKHQNVPTEEEEEPQIGVVE